MKKKKNSLTAAKIMALGFIAAIFIGSILLYLPVSSAPGVETSYIDALFTATTSLCVTGLVTVPTFSQWSIFGKVVIAILIQFGGLGVVACSTIAFIILGRKITLKNRKIIQDSYNLDHMSGMVVLVKRIVLGTLFVEFVGFILYSFVLVPEYGWKSGLGMAGFNAVSAFCNAGMDIIGPDSLRPYADHVLMNMITMLMIILGGLGFVVWWDLIGKGRRVLKKEIKIHQFWERLELHTKIVLVTTASLILGGAVLIFIFEYQNPATMGPMSFGNKVMASIFQSVTTRTAGFETVSQGALTDSSSLISMLLMFIGGSPVGTAGGVKTTTVAILMLTVVAYFEGKRKTDVFHRQLAGDNVRTAIVVIMSGVICIFGMITLLSAATGGDFLDVSYEIVSALGTVGLTRGFTSGLNLAGKIIVIISMYLGRIGPITLASAVTVRSREANALVERPEKRIIIG